MTKTVHWTERTIADYLYSIGAEFMRQLEAYMESNNKTQADIATALGLSPGRVSQLFNKPGNITLKNIIKYARALGLKVAVVPYDDADPANTNGPVPAEVFSICWQRSGSPKDFFDLNQALPQTATAATLATQQHIAKNANEGFFVTHGTATNEDLAKVCRTWPQSAMPSTPSDIQQGLVSARST